MDPVNVAAKFEVRSFTHSWDKNWAVPEYTDAPFSPQFLTGFCSDGHLKSVALPFPEIIAVKVLGGGCEPPILGKGRW